MGDPRSASPSLSRLAALALGATLVACTGPSEPPSVPVSRWGADALAWGACPEDIGGQSIECTQVEVPYDWSAPEARRSTILLRRRLSSSPKARALWALDGGPGFAGDSFFDPKFSDRMDRNGVDLYVPSHRGSVGESALSCPEEQSADSGGGGRVTADEWGACLTSLEDQWGKGLPGFSVRQAALDVAHLVSRSPAADQTLLFGGSYGSLWAHRILLDTDAAFDGVLLDSIVPIGASLERVDENADQAAEALLTACAETPACAARFPGAPLVSARAAIAAFNTGSGCGQGSAGVTRDAIQHFVHGQLAGAPASWAKIIETYERLVRCDASDVDALGQLLHAAGSAEPGPALHYNVLLNRHLLYRELYRFDRSDAEKQAFDTSALARSPFDEEVRREASAFGAAYRRVEPPLRASSSTPTFLLSGRFDPLDPPAWADDFAATLKHVEVAKIPWASHSTLRYLGLASGECGTQVLETFLQRGAPDLSCIASSAAPAL